VSFALLALLTAASVCFAAEPNYAPRKGGIGGGLGLSQFRGQGDYSNDARPRFSFAGNFRYVVSPRFRWQVSPGLMWAAYKKGSPAPFVDINFPDEPLVKNDYLTLLIPASAQLQLVTRHGQWMQHVGAGPGLYRVWVENRRKVLRDPLSLDLHRGVYPGFSVEYGGERFLKNITTTSIELTLSTHYVFARRATHFPPGMSDDTQFPSGLNSNLWAMDFRIGVNYYFDLVRARKVPGAGLPGLSK
jgi:hypothetical protein